MNLKLIDRKRVVQKVIANWLCNRLNKALAGGGFKKMKLWQGLHFCHYNSKQENEGLFANTMPELRFPAKDTGFLPTNFSCRWLQ